MRRSSSPIRAARRARRSAHPPPPGGPAARAASSSAGGCPPARGGGALATAGRPSGALGVIVRAGSPIHAVADLVGRTVTTTRGSIGHHILLQALERAKIPASKVHMTFLSPADAKAAFD